MIKFLWGLLLGAFLGAIGTMWYVKRQMNPSVGNENPVEQSLSIPPDFHQFYEQFHEDTIYQMEHIVFPLQGLPAYADSAIIAEKTFRYQKEDWVLHRNFLENPGQFVRKVTNLGSGMIVEQIEDQQNGVGLQRRFAKRGEEWFLIYYAGINFTVSN